jgi:hypothetical protein
LYKFMLSTKINIPVLNFLLAMRSVACFTWSHPRTRSDIIIYRTGGNYFGLDIILERRGGIVGSDPGQATSQKGGSQLLPEKEPEDILSPDFVADQITKYKYKQFKFPYFIL